MADAAVERRARGYLPHPSNEEKGVEGRRGKRQKKQPFYLGRRCN